MYTQSFIFSAVAVLLAAQVNAAPIRARQTPGGTNLAPVNTLTNLPLALPVNAPLTTITSTSTNTSGRDGKASSTDSGSAASDGPVPRKGSKAAKRANDAASILAASNAGMEQLNETVKNTFANQGTSVVADGLATSAGQNHDLVTRPDIVDGEGTGEDETAGEDEAAGEDETADEGDFVEDEDLFA